MSYDNFAHTFSNSRKNHPWPELDYIIEDMKKEGFLSILDIGCGNGRFIEQLKMKSEEGKIPNGCEYLGIDSSAGMIAEARKLHPKNNFEEVSMESLSSSEALKLGSWDAVIFLASFHHLETKEERMQVLKESKELLNQNGRIYMTNWNLRDQEKYKNSHRGNGDYDIKIGEFSRYYHGFTIEELEELFETTGWNIIQNRVFEGGRNILSIIK